MKQENSTCQQHTYRMPGEFEPHHGTILVWPERPGSWNYGAKAAREAFRQVIYAIARSERVYVAVNDRSEASAREMLYDDVAAMEMIATWSRGDHQADDSHYDVKKLQENIILCRIDTDDAWARDIAPTFVKHYEEDAMNSASELAPANSREAISIAVTPTSTPTTMSHLLGINWRFNAWGGDFDGLYADYAKDDAFAATFCKQQGYDILDAQDFVLEGGAIHSDGEGTLLVTASCLLSGGRNPELTKEQIEQRLKDTLGVKKILWLPRGIYNDETNEHVDNVCAFLAPGEVVLAWTEDEADPQYALSKETYDYLTSVTDAKGRELTIHKLPIPEIPICMTQVDVEGFTFREGEDMREVGERLAASYVNFYFTNDAVLLPVFGGENTPSDERAVTLMGQWVRGRDIIPIPARDILTGGGNIHCITQQIPW